MRTGLLSRPWACWLCKCSNELNQMATDFDGITSFSQLTDIEQMSVTLSEIDRCSVRRCRSVISSNVINRCEEMSANCRFIVAVDCCSDVFSQTAVLTS